MNRYVNWKIVLPWINLPEIDEYQILSDTYNYLRLLNTSTVYQQEFCTLSIKNHKADLPENAQTIEGVAYTPLDLTEIYNSCGELIKEDFYETECYKKTFYFVSPERTSFIQNTCKDCPRPLNSCDITVDIIPETNQLVFPHVQKGTVCISYLTLPTDKIEKDLLIADDAKLHNAIAAYVKYRYWEKEKQMADSNNYNRANNEYREAKREWLLSHQTYIGAITSRKLNDRKLGYFQRRVTNLLKSDK